MASFGIGERLRQERLDQGLSLDDISRDTRIVPRFLDSIEKDDFAELPGLVFTRSFVKQYALALKLDPGPLLAELPTQDESTVRLPDPPARPRSSYHKDRTLHAVFTAAAWLVVAGAASVAYLYFNRLPQTRETDLAPQTQALPVTAPPQPVRSTSVETHPAGGMVQVSLTAHEAAWVQVSADGKTTFTGTLHSNETKEVSAADQVRILTGNAGALTISLNGKTLEPIGPLGQVRTVNLTAAGPQPPSRDSRSAPDPL